MEFVAKSPYKLSTTEKRVIGGLKQLTELLFKQYYKPNSNGQDNVDGVNEPLQSDEVTKSIEYPTPNDTDMQIDKENAADGHFQQKQSDNNTTPDEAEMFCGMVVQQLTTVEPVDHSEEWHRGQLEAYNKAHERIFERAD